MELTTSSLQEPSEVLSSYYYEALREVQIDAAPTFFFMDVVSERASRLTSAPST